MTHEIDGVEAITSIERFRPQHDEPISLFANPQLVENIKMVYGQENVTYVGVLASKDYSKSSLRWFANCDVIINIDEYGDEADQDIVDSIKQLVEGVSKTTNHNVK